MASSWEYIRLGDVVQIQTGFPFKSKDYTEDDDSIRLLRGDNIVQGTLRWENAKRWQSSMVSEVENYLLRPGDIVLAMDRPWIEAGLKYAAISQMDVPSLLVQRVACLRAKPSLDQTYLRYLIGGQDFTSYVLGIQTGTAVPHISSSQIQAFSFPLPPLEHQREVGRVLVALDNRIALLRETNATLEAITQALFKSWFVDFDPVRAKVEGRDPEGVPPEVADLFPSEFEDSELGAIPKGWQVGRLDDLLELQRGFDLPTSTRTPGSIPVISASGPHGFHNVPMTPVPGVVTGRSGVLGKVFLMQEEFFPLNTTLWVKSFKWATPCYAFHLLKGMDLAGYNAGSAVPTLNRNHIHGVKQLLPNKGCIEAFENLAWMVHSRIHSANKEIESLTELRDTLLPRLMSGKLRIPEESPIGANV